MFATFNLLHNMEVISCFYSYQHLDFFTSTKKKDVINSHETGFNIGMPHGKTNNLPR